MQTQPTLLRTNRIALTESRFADMHDVIAGLPKAERTYVAALRHFELTIHGLNLFMERANLRMDTLETTATVVVNGETILIGTPKEEVCGVEERVFPALGVAVALQMDKTTDGSWIGGVRGDRVVPLGVDHFGQSGDVPDLYRAYRLDVEAILDAAAAALEG